MLEALAKGFDGIISSIFRRNIINEQNIKEAIEQLKKVMIGADVNLDVINLFLKEVEEKALGEKIIKGLNAKELFIKIVYEELVKILGGGKRELKIKPQGNTSVVILAGLQGSGKTSTAVKLAYLFRDKKNPLLVAADVYRPAAIEQLKVLGNQAGIKVYYQYKKTAQQIVSEALSYARKKKHDFVIIDTAGRLQIDKNLMEELKNLVKIARPDETLLVVDSMTGQVAADVAKEFSKYVAVSGLVLTKFDSDANGGAALSVRIVSGVPIVFTTVGEHFENIDYCYPDRLAQRIIGMGDVLSLVEKAQQKISEDDAQQLMRRLEKNKFDFNDMLMQIQSVGKMGGLESVMLMIPGASKVSEDKIAGQMTKFKKFTAIIQSMTKHERSNPLLINNPTRKKRVMKGSGTKLIEINQLLKDYETMKKMMMKLKGGKIKPEMLGFDQNMMKNMKM